MLSFTHIFIKMSFGRLVLNQFFNFIFLNFCVKLYDLTSDTDVINGIKMIYRIIFPKKQQKSEVKKMETY